MVLGSIRSRFFELTICPAVISLIHHAACERKVTAGAEAFPDFVQVQCSSLLHFLMQSKHGVQFVAAIP